MVYTSSEDGSMKFWNMEKLNATLPKFDQGKENAKYISTDKVLPPERNLAITRLDNYSMAKRYVSMFHCFHVFIRCVINYISVSPLFDDRPKLDIKNRVAHPICNLKS